jgi:hypothetical protein
MYTVVTEWTNCETTEVFSSYTDALLALHAINPDEQYTPHRYILRDCEYCYGDGEVIADSGVYCSECSGSGGSYPATDVIVCPYTGTFGGVVESRSSYTYEIMFHNGEITRIMKESTFEVAGSFVEIALETVAEIREMLELIGRDDLLPFAPDWTNVNYPRNHAMEADIQEQFMAESGFVPSDEAQS